MHGLSLGRGLSRVSVGLSSYESVSAAMVGATVEVTKVTTTTETATATMALLEQAAVYCCVVIDVAPRQKLAK